MILKSHDYWPMHCRRCNKVFKRGRKHKHTNLCPHCRAEGHRLGHIPKALRVPQVRDNNGRTKQKPG